MPTNHLFTAKIWQQPTVRRLRHAMSVSRMYRSLSAHRRRLPDYLIAGAQKSGTTSLWAYLNDHPRVAPAMTKEMHFFDKNFRRGVNWYRMHFPRQSVPCSDGRENGGTLTGESSAYYMFHPRVPQRVADTVPNAKIILLLRNPVDRAFSHYQLKVRRRQESLPFDAAIRAESERLAGEEERLLREPDFYSRAHDLYSYLARGRYLEQLLRWEPWFGPDQLLVLESGEFFQRTADVYARVLEFLDLPPHRPAVFGNRFPGKYSDRMDATTRRWLVDYFAPHNEALYTHLNTRFDWDR